MHNAISAEDSAALVAERLPILMEALRACSFTDKRPAHHRELLAADDIPILERLLGNLQAPLKAVEDAGLFGNPWSAASLHRNEVRIAAALAWLLNPRGGHGCGDALLVDFLERVRCQLPSFPAQPSSYCMVNVEECPDGDRASRVDVQIDDEKFILIVEVKVDAPEQPGQLERYCQVANARACGRPWAVIFLTTHGRPSVTAGDQNANVVPIKWSAVASELQQSARSMAVVPRFLAKTFATHLSNL